jgi:hypothetical protein
MRIIAFILEPAQVERILTHIGEPAEPPAVQPARAPPQGKFGFAPVDQPTALTKWPEIDQTCGQDTWD